MKKAFLVTLLWAASTMPGIVADAKPTGLEEMLGVLPNYKAALMAKPRADSESPFRKAVAPALTPGPVQEGASISGRISAAITSDSIGAVLTGSGGASIAVIHGEVYSLNEEVRIDDKNSGTRELVGGYLVVLRKITATEIVLEALVRGAASSAAPITVRIPLDDFFQNR